MTSFTREWSSLGNERRNILRFNQTKLYCKKKIQFTRFHGNINMTTPTCRHRREKRDRARRLSEPESLEEQQMQTTDQN